MHSMWNSAMSPLKVGDRVTMASSIAGSKTGTLQYLGVAEFAEGDWAGIELDAPLGKNDGSVNGKRYFQCKTNFGLFVPPYKIKKVAAIPSNGTYSSEAHLIPSSSSFGAFSKTSGDPAVMKRVGKINLARQVSPPSLPSPSPVASFV